MVQLEINMERKNTDLVKEFNRYVREHAGFADKIPPNAVVIMQLEGDEEFNNWSFALGKAHAEKNQPIVLLKLKDKTHPLTY